MPSSQYNWRVCYDSRNLTDKERAAVCPDCGCVAYKKSQHASGCPRGSDPTGAKLQRDMRRAEARLKRNNPTKEP